MMSREGKPALQPLRVAMFCAGHGRAEGRAPLRWGLLTGQGQGGNELSLSSSTPFGELSNSSRPLLKSRFMGQPGSPLLCPLL